MTQHAQHGIYCIWDRKAQLALPAFSSANDVTAERQFVEAVLHSETPVSQYPADFDLIRIGTVDLQQGTLSGITPPQLIVNGLVSLTEAHRQRERYKTILEAVQAEEPAPEAAS